MPQNVEAPPVRPDGLQIDDNRGYQEKLWRVERWAWVAFAAIALAAILGMTGAGGPLARKLSEFDGATIEYARVARWQAADEIVVRFGAGGMDRTLTLAPQFAQSFQVEDIQPTPRRVEAGPEGEILHFHLNSGGPARVVVHVRALHPGLVRYQARVDGGLPHPLSTLVLP